jgi:CheY-like chemotaxis protein
MGSTEKILVAVNNDADRRSIISALKSSGIFSVYEIGEIVSASEAFARVNPSAIIADTNFTDWFLAQLSPRNQEDASSASPRPSRGGDIPIICYIKYNNARLAYDYLKKGAYDCIADPIRPIEIVDIINKSLSKDMLAFDKTSKQNILDYFAALPRVKKIIFTAAVAGFLAFSWWMVYVFSSPSSSRSIEIPQRHVTGVIAGEKTFYVSDWYTQSIYRYDRRRGDLLDVYYFSDYGPLGLATDGVSIYSVGTDLKVRRYIVNDAAHKLEKTDEYDISSLGSPGGIFIEGGFLWAGDVQAKKIILYEIVKSVSGQGALKELSEYSTGEISPVALWKKGDVIYVADGKSGSVFTGRLVDTRFIPQKETPPDLKDSRITAFYLIKGNTFLTVFSVGEKTILRRSNFKKIK